MPMKVTVCFDNVRVLVPCGDGDIPVSELINKAIVRYKKATGKSSGHWISVNNLKTISGGGILDPDDQLSDVVDDREQLIAIFEEQGRIPGHHNGGDGASASSTGTASPDIFQSGESTHSSSVTNSYSSIVHNKTDVVVTSRDLSLGSSLTVRRGSESALDLIGLPPVQNGTKSSTPVPPKEDFRESDEPRSESESEERKYPSSNQNTLERRKNNFNSVFNRDTNRQSLSNQPDMFRWLEAAERQESKFNHERKGPVGSSSLEEESPEDIKSVVKDAVVREDVVLEEEGKDEEDDEIIVLINDGGPLGIHVIPDLDSSRDGMGLMIQGVEKGGKVYKDGRLKEDDKITEINGQSLQKETFKRAQDIFREAMKTKELRLRVKKAVPPLPNKPPPVLPKPKNHSPLKPSPLTLTSNSNSQDQPVPSERTNGTHDTGNKIIKPNSLPLDQDKPGLPVKPSDLSPSKKTPPAVPVRHPSTSLTHDNKEAKEQSAFLALKINTRKIGKKINIQLRKGELGLGFSVTSRDNLTDSEIPIYIKNILPQGAAITDGRLKPGDRLLEVNGEGMTGKTQSEAVAYLRKIPKNSLVELVVSRQEVAESGENREPEDVLPSIEVSPDNKLTSSVMTNRFSENENTITNLQNTEVILLDIPLIGVTGLGVSVKGKSISTVNGSKDLGIFIKSVMPEGAAYKDGRLAINDQLLEINGEKLVGLSNLKAMEKLRNAMQQDGPIAGHTFLSVARKVGAPSPFAAGESTDITDSAELVMQGGNSAIDTNNGNSQIYSAADRTKPNNPLLNRLMGNVGNVGSPGPPGLRNESYTRATQDSFYNDSNNSMDHNVLPSSVTKNKLFLSPTVYPTNQEEVIIENDAYSLPKKSQFRPRPHSTIGVPIKQDESTSSTEDLHPPVPKHRQTSSLDNTHLDSDLSPEGDPAGFSREGFGRQSMSEKRKGHIDPRTTEQFWRVRSGREHRTASVGNKTGLKRSDSADSVRDICVDDYSSGDFYHWNDDNSSHVRSVSNTSSTPGNTTSSSNLKRSTSLEDLTISESNLEDEDTNAMDARSINRPRACNESFRAAVDRSYESHATQQAPSMDTLEEESLESEAFSHGNSGNSARSSLSSDNDHGFLGKKKSSKEKKSGGLFKGFLRLGKNRKSNEEARLRSRSAERPSNEEVDLHQFQREQAWQIAQKEKLRLQEQRRIQQQQAIETHRAQQQRADTYNNKQNDQNSNKQTDHYGTRSEMLRNRQDAFSANQQIYGNRQSEIYAGKSDVYLQTGHPDLYGSKNFPPHSSQSQVHFNSLPRPSTKTEKIQQLRAEHQRKHQERQGSYPLDAAEEYYERRMMEDERRRNGRSGSESHVIYARPSSRGQPIDRPSSRQGPNFMTSATEYSPHPSLSDDNEYSHASIPNKQQTVQNNPPQHLQQRPASRGYPSEQSRGYPSDQYRGYPLEQSHCYPHEQSRSYVGQSEQSRGLRNYSSEQPLASRSYPSSDQWYRQQDQDNNSRRIGQVRTESTNNVKSYYKDPQTNYRDPGYSVYNGRRGVPSMADPSSAKV